MNYLSNHPEYQAEEDVDYLDDDLQGQFDQLRDGDAAAGSSATGIQGQSKRAEEHNKGG